MNKKFIFFDIDGTLTIKETGEILPSVRRTIKKLQENHIVAIASGRAYYKVKAVVEDLRISYVVANGGAALAIDGKLVGNYPLDRDKAIALLKQADELNLGWLVAYEDSISVVMRDTLFIEQAGFRQEPTRYYYRPELKIDDLKEIYKVYIALSRQQEALLSERKNIGYIRFADPYLIFQNDAKDLGIKRMVEMLGGSDEDVFVFGDDYNDMVMFRDEWTCIAMGNGCDALKEKATFVTRKNSEDGIEYACQHYNLI